MIYELAKELDADLRAVSVPLRVVAGPERTQPTTLARERIVLDHDEGGDSFGAPTTPVGNPRAHMNRRVGAVLRIYAQATVVGATVQDHRRRAEAVLDRVLVALDKRLRGTRKTQWLPQSGAFVSADQLSGSETWSGAVYELKFSVDRSVRDRKWDGSARAEGTLSGFNNTTIVHLGDEEEVACGEG